MAEKASATVVVHELRRAAQIVRERAEKATPGLWTTGPEIQGTKDINAPGKRVCGKDWPDTLAEDANWIVLVGPLSGPPLAALFEEMANVIRFETNSAGYLVAVLSVTQTLVIRLARTILISAGEHTVPAGESGEGYAAQEASHGKS